MNELSSVHHQSGARAQSFKRNSRSTRSQVHSLLAALKVCIASRDLERGKTIHAKAAAAGIDSNIFLASNLITMYSKCGSMIEARRAFDRISSPPDLALWTVLILGYADNGEGDLALNLFARMKSQGCEPDARAYVAALKACSSLAAQEPSQSLQDGKAVKFQALERGLKIFSEAGFKLNPIDNKNKSNSYVTNTMVNLLAKCGDLEDARRIFDGMVKPDLISLNSLILGYAENGEETSGLELYVRIFAEGVLEPNERTFAALLKACTGLASKERSVKKICLEIGMALHSQAVKFKCDSEIFVASTLVDMYATCGSLEDAKLVFDAMKKTGRGSRLWSFSFALEMINNSFRRIAEALLLRSRLAG